MGTGNFNTKLTSGDLFSFDTILYEWKKLKPLKYVDPRKHHAACDFGSFMLVSGGIPEESSVPFRDFHAYDPSLNEWFKI